METVYFGHSRRLPLLHCPNCNRLTDGATPISRTPEDPRPKPGDFTICIYCTAWLVFEESIASITPICLRLARPSEVEELYRRNPVAHRMQQAARHAAGNPQRG